MKKLLIFFASITTPLALALSTVPAAAQFSDICNQPNAQSSQVCQGGQDEIVGGSGIVNRVANLIGVIGGILAVIILIVSGFMFVFARGDSGRIKLARETIIYTLVGVVVLVLARIIVAFTIGVT